MFLDKLEKKSTLGQFDKLGDINLTQLVNQPTHTAGNIFDLSLTNIPDNIFNLHIQDSHPLPIPSDHYIISLAFSPLQSLAKPVNQLIS